MNIFWRFLLPIIFLVVTFWPDYGMAWLAVGLFPQFPIIVSIVAATWAILFSLLLPLPVRIFRTVSTSLVVLVLALTTYAAYAGGMLPPLSLQIVVIYSIVVIGVVLGWLTVSTRIWRFLHSIVAVEDQHA